jgi:hypothetical protein
MHCAAPIADWATSADTASVTQGVLPIAFAHFRFHIFGVWPKTWRGSSSTTDLLPNISCLRTMCLTPTHDGSLDVVELHRDECSKLRY